LSVVNCTITNVFPRSIRKTTYTQTTFVWIDYPILSVIFFIQLFFAPALPSLKSHSTIGKPLGPFLRSGTRFLLHIHVLDIVVTSLDQILSFIALPKPASVSKFRIPQFSIFTL
jgi:hypothetical protein